MKDFFKWLDREKIIIVYGYLQFLVKYWHSKNKCKWVCDIFFLILLLNIILYHKIKIMGPSFFGGALVNCLNSQRVKPSLIALIKDCY